MADTLTTEDLDIILEALGYKKQAVTDYKDYPSYEFKRAQIARVESAIEKVRAIRNARPR
jgi:signal recognition particle subunit SEC65